MQFFTASGNNFSTEKLRIDSSGRLLVGTTSTNQNISKIVVKASSPSDTYDNHLYLEGSETTGDANTGGVLGFGGHDGASSARNWANIWGVKENSTDGNTAAYMAFHTRANGGNPAERVRITSDGRVFINTTAVTNTHDQLTVKRAAASFGEMSLTVDANTTTDSAANAFFFAKPKHTYWGGYGFQSSHGHIGAIVGKRDSTGGDSDQEIRIEIGGTHINQSEEKTWNFKNNGDLSISDGNLILASGHGIDFSANTGASGMTSELLDHYEEGTFTPAVTSGLSAGQISYNSRSGKYTRVGNLVTFTMHMNINSATLDSGALKFGGLPFTTSNVSHTAGGMWKIFTNGNIDAGATYKVEGNSTDIQVVTGAGDAMAANATSIDAGHRHMAYWGFYYV